MDRENIPHERAARSPRQRRLTLLGAMLLIAAIAVGLAIWDYNRRVRVVFVNQSAQPVRLVKIRHDGRTVEFGPVPPRSTISQRIRWNSAATIHVGFDVKRSGRLFSHPFFDHHTEMPGLKALGPSKDFTITFRGP